MESESKERAHLAIKRRLVGCEYSHLWSDALFARQLAEEQGEIMGRFQGDEPRMSQAEWNVGTLARLTVVTACMAFERACLDALDATDEERDSRKGFIAKLLAILERKGLSIDRSRHPWAGVDAVRGDRNEFVHGTLKDEHLFAGLPAAKRAIASVREGVVAIYELSGKVAPEWVKCDVVPRPPGSTSAWLRGVHAGAQDDPQAITVVAVQGEREHVRCIMPSGADPWPEVEALVSSVLVPLSAIRVYQGSALVFDEAVPMRGSVRKKATTEG